MNKKTRRRSDGKQRARAIARHLKADKATADPIDNAHPAEATVNALTILATKKPDIVWSHNEFARELERAKRTGPKNMSNDHLMDFCVGVRAYYGGRFLVDACPFFKELWRRIRSGELHMTKTEACRQIGCTRQWANAIVSGRAEERRKARSKAKGAKGGNPVSDVEASTVLTKDEYVREISKNVFAKLAPLLKNHWDLYRDICEELSKQFAEASKTPAVAKASAAGAS